jgi:hypothetical protein
MPIPAIRLYQSRETHLKIVDPSTVIVEKTAGEFAATFFEAARSSGLDKIQLQGDVINLKKYKNNPRNFARVHIEKFIPAAVHALNEIMCNPKTPEAQRELIYKALMERVNDPGLDMIAQTAGLPELMQAAPFKHDDEKPKPLIINGAPFDFNNLKKGTPNGKVTSGKTEG